MRVKRIISLALIVLSLFSVIPVVFAGSDADIQNALDILGIVNAGGKYNSTAVDYESKVTRAEFADMVVDILNYETHKADNTYYYDVSQEYWAYNSIGVLTEFGYFKGRDEHKFMPDEYIEQREAYMVLLRVLGYGDFINSGSITEILRATEINRNISLSGYLTIGDMLIMLSNTLKAEMVKYDISGNNMNYYNDEDDTFFARYYNIYKETGRVTTVDSLSMDGVYGVDFNTVFVGGTEYEYENINMQDYFGITTEIFYCQPEKDGDKTILYAHPYKNKEKIVKVKVDDYRKYNSETRNFSCVNEKSEYKTVTIVPSVTVIYNNDIVEENFDSLLQKQFTELKLISTEGSNKFDIVIIRDSQKVLVNAIDVERKIIYDEINASNSVCYDKDKYEYLKFDDEDKLNTEDVLNLYYSLDGKKLEIQRENCKTNGVVTSISKNDDFNELTVNNIKYKVYKDVALPVINDTVTLFCDIYGFVVCIKDAEIDGLAGYVVKPAILTEDEVTYTECVMMRLLTEDGMIKRFYLEENVKIDGIRYKTQDKAFMVLKDIFGDTDRFKPSLVLYSLNEAGKITEIKTNAGESGVNSFRKNNAYGTYYYRYTGMVGSKMFLNNSTKIFFVPSDESILEADEDEFRVGKTDLLTADIGYSLETYATDDVDGYEEYVVVKGVDWNSQSSNGTPLLVDSISVALNSEGEMAYKLIGYQGAGKLTVTTKDMNIKGISDITTGDLISFTRNVAGDVISIKRLYDYDGVNSTSNTNTWSSRRVVVGYVHEKAEGLLGIGYNSGEDLDEKFTASTYVIYDSELRKNAAYAGTVNDILSYKDAGNACSKICAYVNHGSAQIVIIYK